MLSNQILQRTINEIGDIIECNCSIWNTDGVMLAAVGKEKPAVKKAVCSFLKELEVTGVSEEHLDECYGLFPVYDDDELTYIFVIGEMSDRMVELGGTSILSETTEFIGAEHILARRGKTKEISDRIYQIVHDYEHAIKLVGHDIREGNPSPGNKEGGLTTLEEKSLGCIHKGGHSEVTAVYDVPPPIRRKSPSSEAPPHL